MIAGLAWTLRQGAAAVVVMLLSAPSLDRRCVRGRLSGRGGHRGALDGCDRRGHGVSDTMSTTRLSSNPRSRSLSRSRALATREPHRTVGAVHRRADRCVCSGCRPARREWIAGDDLDRRGRVPAVGEAVDSARARSDPRSRAPNRHSPPCAENPLRPRAASSPTSSHSATSTPERPLPTTTTGAATVTSAAWGRRRATTEPDPEQGGAEPANGSESVAHPERDRVRP